ncbi:MAG: hypothetical protein KGS72_21245 [Cyanobacteria bacterium REEB67]|nr:hypothetical protein [Cyanobacteria bacterium REEB67]
MVESAQSLLDAKVASALNLYQLSYRVFACDPTLADTSAFCEHYGYTLDQAANTIIVATKGESMKFACCVVLAVSKLDVNKKVSGLLGTKKYIDSKILQVSELVFGGGNRSSKVLLAPDQLRKMPGVEFIEALGIPKQAP